jgi:hypothetical protein
MTERELTPADWRGFRQADFPQHSWILDDGMLRARAGATPVDLILREAYREFAFYFEWRLPRAGSSGVFYRVTEDQDQPWKSGLEMQLLDDEHHAEGISALTSCGALCGLIAPWHELRAAANVYHAARIVVRGAKVEHWIDDRQVLGYELGTEELADRIARSRFRDYPQFGRTEDGHIVLQHDGTEAWFRRMRIETP